MTSTQVHTVPSRAPRPLACPCCGARAPAPFYAVTGIPVHDAKLIQSRQAALGCARGDLALTLCRGCGFIWNTAFQPALLEYDTDYEPSQSASPTFTSFHTKLARELIEHYGLRGKSVLEIGCGQGEFLALLAKLGGNRGLGFDPAYLGDLETEHVSFQRAFYSEAFADTRADFVCCKMTLEHIDAPAAFLQGVRRAQRDRRDTVVFFQVPETRRILAERAFWDIYYEHCSYFTSGSLARAFRGAGFEVLRVWKDYGDQYLMIDARPGGAASAPLPEEESVAELTREVQEFRSAVTAAHVSWRELLAARRRAGQRVVVWSAGSKTVAFLTTLGVGDEVAYAVDIHPRRPGTFLAGTGHPVHAPQALREQPPDLVLVMNPVYRDEIRRDLAAMDLHPELLVVDEVR